jgi:hypothetical protein
VPPEPGVASWKLAAHLDLDVEEKHRSVCFMGMESWQSPQWQWASDSPMTHEELVETIKEWEADGASCPTQ